MNEDIGTLILFALAFILAETLIYFMFPCLFAKQLGFFWRMLPMGQEVILIRLELSDSILEKKYPGSGNLKGIVYFTENCYLNVRDAEVFTEAKRRILHGYSWKHTSAARLNSHEQELLVNGFKQVKY